MRKPRPRREGFTGQHLVVLPEPLRAAARAEPLLRDFFVTDAGYFPRAAGHLVERPDGAPTTLLVLCLRGSGWIQLAGRTQALAPGDLAWLPARQPHAYGADPRTPWTISWVHVAGEQVPAWRDFLRTCGKGDGPVFHLPEDNLPDVALDRVTAALERGFALRHQLAAANAVRASLGAIGEILVERHGHRTARERVVASVAGLERDYLRTPKLDELAAAAGMSVTHYCAHFRQVTGFAPIDYVIRLRMRRACQLLDTSPLGVRAIAEAVGYDDPYYFSRCFKRVMGRSPAQYRKISKG